MNFKDWNWHRIIRTLLGTVILYGAFIEKETILYVVAFFLFYQVVFNIKCISSIVPEEECKK